MGLPEITHLQYQILSVLMGSERSGQSVRNELREQGVKKSGPGFYQLMARLEDARLVKGWYQQRQIGDQLVKERWYELTAGGKKAWRTTSDFYAKQFARAGKWGLAHG
jgi:DNA-binding PadR family transcriptional regulator